jgi:lysozyme
MNQAGLDLLKHYEGFRADAYRDMVGKWTIGYGFTKDVKPDDKMTVPEADARLLTELEDYKPDCEGTENQISAMQCLAWNIGKQSLDNSTVLRMHKAGNFEAAANAFLMWDKAGGRVVLGLVRRRESERNLYLT